MKEQKRWSLIMGFGFAAAAILITGHAASAADEQPEPEKLFVETHKCNMCHSVAAAGIEAKTSSEKMKGPDLSGFETKKSFAELASFIKKNSQLDGKDHKKSFKGSDEELRAIVDWLGSLEPQK